MASKTKKKYTYFTKAVLMPDGTRKYIRAKTREELDEKVLQAQILVKSAWISVAKKPSVILLKCGLISIKSLISAKKPRCN